MPHLSAVGISGLQAGEDVKNQGLITMSLTWRASAEWDRRWALGLVISLLLHVGALTLWPRHAPTPPTAGEPLAVRLLPAGPAVSAPASPLPAAPTPPAPKHTATPEPRPTPPARKPEPRPAPTRPLSTPSPSATPAAASPASAPAAAASSSSNNANSAAASTGPAAGAGSGEARTPARWQAAYLHNPPPDYPWQARQRGQQGVVWLSVEVSAAGECAQASVLRSSGVSALDQAALAAVRRWRFVPARQGQTPVESKVEIPIRFKLSDEGAEE